jgi:hypothetical protein
MSRDVRARRSGTCCAVILVVAGCAPPPITAPAPTSRLDPCLIAPPPAVAPDSLSIAFAVEDGSGISAPARFDPSRFIYELTHETLVGVDCAGTLLPELAQHWEADASGRVWTFTIRADRRWANGEPALSRDVIAAWRSLRRTDDEFAGVIDSAQAIDARRIRVAIGGRDVRMLAAPELSIVLRDPETGRIDGTGAYTSDGSPRQSRVAGSSAADLPRLRHVRLEPGVDPRDVLDDGIDVMFTGDPAIARYAAAREDLAVAPLPPQRTYAVVAPRPVDLAEIANSAMHMLRVSLADEVVQVPATPASGAHWWSDAFACALSPAHAPLPSDAPVSRVAYREDDAVARAIAERLVSLASRREDSVATRLLRAAGDAAARPIAAEAMPAADFAQALRGGTHTAFVLSIPVRPLATCTATSELATAIPWAVEGRAIGGRFVTPLVDTGAWAIVRQGAVGLVADWDGTPRLLFSRARDVGESR